MGEHELLALIAASALAATHLLGVRRSRSGARSAWLSAFAGVSVAYVFVHLLPELAAQQRVVGDWLLQDDVYLVALLGVATFYGIETHSLRSRAAGGDGATGEVAFWVSIGSFSVYNAIVGYLLMRNRLEAASLLALYTFAVGVHLLVNDMALREHHRRRYHRVGRWILAAAVLAGWAVGVTTTVPERAIAVTLAFIGGGVVLNVMKEELPGDRTGRFLPFAVGAAAYAALLQVA